MWMPSIISSFHKIANRANLQDSGDFYGRKVDELPCYGVTPQPVWRIKWHNINKERPDPGDQNSHPVLEGPMGNKTSTITGSRATAVRRAVVSEAPKTAQTHSAAGRRKRRGEPTGPRRPRQSGQRPAHSAGGFDASVSSFFSIVSRSARVTSPKS